MRQISYFFTLVLLLGISSCGESPAEVKIPELEIPVVNPDTSGGKSTADFELHIKERIEKGDTSVIAPERFGALLTDTIEGYTLEFDKASKFETSLFTFSEATKVFYNENEQYIELTAGDYVRNPDFFRVNLQRYNLAQGVEISGLQDLKIKPSGFAPEKAKDFFAWASFNSRKRLAWIYVGLDERYFITIEATDQDDFLDIAKVKTWLDWAQLYR